MRIALIQMPVGFDKTKNISYAVDKIKNAVNDSAGLGVVLDMAVLPEMFCCPYSNRYFREFGEEHGGEAQSALSALSRELGIYIVGGSIPELCENKVFNTSFVYDDKGREIARHRKVHLFDIDIKNGQKFRESETLCAGDKITTFETPFGIIGLCICFDFRFEEMARIMAQRGASAIVVPGAFNMTTGPAHWELMFRQRAVDNQLFTLGIAPARDESGLYVSYGNSIAVSPWGGIIARCGGEEATLVVDLDFSLNESIREQLPILRSRRTDLYKLSEL